MINRFYCSRSNFLLVLGMIITCCSSALSHDSTYVDDHSKNFTARAYLLKENFDFRVLNGPGNQVVKYTPNNNTELGAWLYYKWLGIGFGVNAPFSNRDTESKGESKIFDIKAHIYQKKWYGWLYFQRIGGFYVLNTQDIFKEWNPEKYYVRPDMGTVSIGGQGTYIFNHEKFSFRANYLQNVAQKKTAGSALLTVHFRHFGVKMDSSIVPGKVGGKFNPGDRVRRAQFNIAGIAPGYSYTFVHKRMFVNGTAMIGLALQDQTIYAGPEPRTFLRFNAKTQLRFTVGINYDKFFLGAGYVNLVERIKVNEARFNIVINDFQAWIGTRF